ncbi:hypothetical protein VKT23_015185 [Stygiomarasmius scandens]|uniref:Uncharacterized protein n=2 Tax=Marasmiellus scandens TaxID=2682957 RepID=A0ABR1J2S1_9AGAR
MTSRYSSLASHSRMASRPFTTSTRRSATVLPHSPASATQHPVEEITMAPIADIFDAPTRLEGFGSQFRLKGDHSSPSTSSSSATAWSSGDQPIAGPSRSISTFTTLPSPTILDGPARPRHSIASRHRRLVTAQKLSPARPHGQMATYSSYLNDMPMEIFDGPSRISGQRYRAPPRHGWSMARTGKAAFMFCVLGVTISGSLVMQ